MEALGEVALGRAGAYIVQLWFFQHQSELGLEPQLDFQLQIVPPVLWSSASSRVGSTVETSESAPVPAKGGGVGWGGVGGWGGGN